jgi:WD40 repeat protein
MPKRFVWSVAFSPDCTLLATGSSDCLVRLWDVHSTTDTQSPRLLEVHSSAVTAVVFSPNGRLLVSGATNGSIRLWDTTSWTMQEISASSQKFAASSPKIHAVAFSPDSQTLASCTEYGRIALYTASTERRLDDDGPWRISIADLTGHTFHGGIPTRLSAIHDVAFSPSGKLLASCGMNKKIVIWEVSSGEIVQILHGHTEYVLGLSFSADGRTLTSCGEDKTIRLWRLLQTDTAMPHHACSVSSSTLYDRVEEEDAQVDDTSVEGSTGNASMLSRGFAKLGINFTKKSG